MSCIYAFFSDSLKLFDAMRLLKQKGFNRDSMYIYSKDKWEIHTILSRLKKNKTIKKQYEKFLEKGGKILSLETGVMKIWKAQTLLLQAEGKKIVKKFF
jgi:hypothetical protein